MAIPWPRILVPSSERWDLRSTSRSGGQSFGGGEQIVQSPAARWTATLTVPCNTDAKVLAMRGVLAGLDGRSGVLLVGPIEVRRAPWFVDPLTGGRITYGEGTRDATIDPAYAANPDTRAALDFRTSAAAQMNATSLTLRRYRGGSIGVGQFFSINDRLHMVAGLVSGDPGTDAPQTITLRPWLREAIPNDSGIEFGAPRGRMRLASDDTASMELALSRFATVTLDLVEAF